MITLTAQLPPMPVDIPSARLQGLFDAYGAKYPFLTFWQQEMQGQITACLGRFYGHFTLWANPAADFEELREFLQVLAEGEVFCTASAAEKLDFSSKTDCIGLECDRLQTASLPLQDSALAEVYRLLQFGADGPVQLPPFADWYPDFSHRLRHGCAAVVSTPHSVAVAGFVTPAAAVITGVAVDPQHRGQGQGAQIVAQLCAELQKQRKRIFVYTTPAVAPFYEKLGFLKGESVCIARV